MENFLFLGLLAGLAVLLLPIGLFFASRERRERERRADEGPYSEKPPELLWGDSSKPESRTGPSKLTTNRPPSQARS